MKKEMAVFSPNVGLKLSIKALIEAYKLKLSLLDLSLAELSSVQLNIAKLSYAKLSYVELSYDGSVMLS